MESVSEASSGGSLPALEVTIFPELAGTLNLVRSLFMSCLCIAFNSNFSHLRVLVVRGESVCDPVSCLGHSMSQHVVVHVALVSGKLRSDASASAEPVREAVECLCAVIWVS